MGKTILEVTQSSGDTTESGIFLSAYDQMLDRVGDEIAKTKKLHQRSILTSFLDKIYRHEVSLQDFEVQLESILLYNAHFRTDRIVKSVRKQCEAYLGSRIQYGPKFPEWLQRKTATVVDVSSGRVILDIHNHSIRKEWSNYPDGPLLMKHARFLQRIEDEAIWVPTVQQIVDRRRHEITCLLRHNEEQVQELLSQNGRLQTELDEID